MAKQKTLAFSAEILDQLLDGQDPTTVLRSAGLIGELKKALAERMLNAEMDVHLDAEAEQATGNHRNGSSQKTVLGDDGEWVLSIPLRVSEILCVSRVRESVIGSKSFTELDSELRFCCGPREGWIGPLGGQIAQRQPDQFSGGLIIREMPLVADTLAHTAM